MTDKPNTEDKPTDKPGGTQADVKAEATDEKATVSWRGITFDISRNVSDWSFDAILAFETGRKSVVLRELLPPAAWRAFHATNPKGADMVDLHDTLVTALGVTSGD